MSWREMARRMGISLADLVGWENECEMGDQSVFGCVFIDELVSEGLVSEDLSEVLAVN